jgi:hypothetical protein
MVSVLGPGPGGGWGWSRGRLAGMEALTAVPAQMPCDHATLAASPNSIFRTVKSFPILLIPRK